MSCEPPASSPRPDSVVEAALDAFLLAEDAGLLGGVSVELWDDLPEEFCRDHELDRGMPIKRHSGSLGHQTAMRRFANAIEQAARGVVRDGLHACLAVNQDSDVRLWDVPAATVRRPDVLAYRCLEDGDTKLWARSVLLVVEIVSPSSKATDTGRDDPRTGFESKMTQYATAGIPHYWIVRLLRDDSAIASIEERRRDADKGGYVQVAIWINGENADAMRTEVPFPIRLSWADLEF